MAVGTIVKLSQGREITAALLDETGKKYEFSFFSFHGYSGQDLRELTAYGSCGIQKGIEVYFEKNSSNRVTRVFPKKEYVAEQTMSPHSP